MIRRTEDCFTTDTIFIEDVSLGDVIVWSDDVVWLAAKIKKTKHKIYISWLEDGSLLRQSYRRREVYDSKNITRVFLRRSEM